MKYDFNCTLAKLSADELARKIEEYAEDGWELETVFESGAGFIKSVPKKIHAYVEPGKKPDDVKKQLYKDFGWDFKIGFAFYSVYVNTSDNPIPVNTDRQELAQSLKKSAVNTILINVIISAIFFAITVVSIIWAYPDMTDLTASIIWEQIFFFVSYGYMLKIMRMTYRSAKDALEECDMNTSQLTVQYTSARIFCIAAYVVTMITWLYSTVMFFIIAANITA